MLNRTDLVYLYDGTFEGFLTCVFESYDKRETPIEIRTVAGQQSVFDATVWIETDRVKADRVHQGIVKKIGREALELVQKGFLTCVPSKELVIYQFIRYGFKLGHKVMNHIADDEVHNLTKAVRHLNMECHRYKGFVRFSTHDNVLISVIEPKNMVLPLLVEHFCERFANETFMIFDKAHRMALIYKCSKAELIQVEDITLPDIDEQEEDIRRLWKKFFDTIAIEGRYNPKCQRTLMPKRYWKHMVEHNLS